MGVILELLSLVAGVILTLVGLNHDPHVVWMLVVGVILMALGGVTFIFIGDGDDDWSPWDWS